MSFCGLCLLLLLGKLLRSNIHLLQRIYLPSSVVGGLIGLCVLSLSRSRFPELNLQSWTSGWSSMPGFLINVVFASLFIGSSLPKMRKVWRLGSAQLCFGQICAWGQYVVGLGLAMLLLIPVFEVSEGFGTLLEIGFSGGHGTVGGMTQTFEQMGWAEGSALGYTMATAGMVLGISLGMVLINFAVSRGWVTGITRAADRDALALRGIYPPDQQPSAGKQTIHSDSLDSLAFHVAIIGMAVFFGFLMKQGLLALNTVMPASVQELHVLESFPLFPLCMLGGLLLQGLLRMVKLSALVDSLQIQRLSGAALDFLVVSAVASIRIEFVADFWLPLLLLIVAGTLWNVFCVLMLGPRFFRESWFERSVTEFGQSMGVTATGLLLLRTVDPENKSVALKSFGYKQLLHEPIMGGGIWTSVAFPLVLTMGNSTVLFISGSAVCFWFVFWYFVVRRQGAIEERVSEEAEAAAAMEHGGN